jgi:hypothetical protein
LVPEAASPAAVYLVQDSAALVTPEGFAALLAEEMRSRERSWPRRGLTGAESAAVQQARSAAEFEGRPMWAPEGSTAWTVVLDQGKAFEPVVPARFARLHVVDTMGQAMESLLCGARIDLDGGRGRLERCGSTPGRACRPRSGSGVPARRHAAAARGMESRRGERSRRPSAMDGVGRRVMTTCILCGEPADGTRRVAL